MLELENKDLAGAGIMGTNGVLVWRSPLGLTVAVSPGLLLFEPRLTWPTGSDPTRSEGWPEQGVRVVWEARDARHRLVEEDTVPNLAALLEVDWKELPRARVKKDREIRVVGRVKWVLLDADGATSWAPIQALSRTNEARPTRRRAVQLRLLREPVWAPASDLILAMQQETLVAVIEGSRDP